MTIPLQRCAACGVHQYPERDLCRACLADALERQENDGRGRLVAQATLHRSLDPAPSPPLPVRIGTVALDAGVRIIAFLADEAAPGDRVVLRPMPGTGGRQRFIAEKDRDHG